MESGGSRVSGASSGSMTTPNMMRLYRTLKTRALSINLQTTRNHFGNY